MHIAVQQGVDKINSLQADMLLSQEIDIELNKSMSRFINSKYGKNNIYRKLIDKQPFYRFSFANPIPKSMSSSLQCGTCRHLSLQLSR